MSKYDKNYDPKVLIGQCELISRFSDFVLYLGTQLVYEDEHNALGYMSSLALCLTKVRSS